MREEDVGEGLKMNDHQLCFKELHSLYNMLHPVSSHPQVGKGEREKDRHLIRLCASPATNS